MSETIATSKESDKPLCFRIWHWVNGSVLLLSILTVVLRKTFLNSKKIAATLQGELGTAGITVSEDQARTAGRAIRDGMWEWHYRLGFVLAGLLLIRILFVKRKLPRPKGLKNSIHAAFFAAIAFMAVTGLVMYFSSSLGISEEVVDEIVEIHELGQWFFFAFVPLHILGVIRAETTNEPGITSSMIHGKDS
ncbi:MAG: cytochrome b/b6 domain-containing protein [Bdellovibrionales bacterium]|nr:cytochrome b/b6 domain-containing protein [Bdellovibrionales bacterium]